MPKKAKTTRLSNPDRSQSALPTFMEHVQELQGRLFGVVLAFIATAAAAYPFFDRIVAVILAPLAKDQQLVYLTPGGAFSFIIMVCMYVGVIGALPVIIFNLYRFLMPVMRQVHLRTVLAYTAWSLILAIIGVLFAYFVMLPASLHFLTSFDLYHIDPMLTVDSYFSFVMTYIVSGALLFQLPLIMLIINSVTPLTPGKLMNYQRHILVGSFIVAAILTPTPDVLNQTLLASPIVVMYQAGIAIVWLRNLKRKREAKIRENINVVKNTITVPVALDLQKDHIQYGSGQSIPSEIPHALLNNSIVTRPSRAQSVDGFDRARNTTVVRRASLAPTVRTSPRLTRQSLPRRSIDGFVAAVR